jgi:hypothetical protein
MIKEGDRVMIEWERGKTVSIVTIVHTPRGAGDLWQVKSDEGYIFAINPYSPDFVRFSRKINETDN